jgi:hypothetical protein
MAHRAARVKEVRFHNPRLAKVGVEVLSVGALLRREGPKLLGSPQRVDFYHLLLVEFGRARHMVDFVEYDLRPGSVMLVRPGEVQQWRMREGVQGQLVLISSEALTPTVPRSNRDMRLLSLNDWPTVSRPTRILFEEAKADVARLASDAERFEGTDLEAAIIRHQLLSLLLRMARELRTQLRKAPHRLGLRQATRLFRKLPLPRFGRHRGSNCKRGNRSPSGARGEAAARS